jgi:hypothetical protein
VFKRREKLDPHPNLTCKNAFLMVGYVEAEAEVETEAGGSGVEGMGGFTSSMSSNTSGCMITILFSILRLGKMFLFSSP